ncbi:MAG: hypothetical protein VKK98_09950 [Cyanobacteriota bacterium]|nr:hypothetical protein [Cyanobacteriota bacterium]
MNEVSDAITADPQAAFELVPRLLGATALLLLVFVSLGVIYLSTVEWRDRRRRRAAEQGSDPGPRLRSEQHRRS